MKLCLIIGFNYDNTLSSSSIDMYLMYKFFNSRGFQSIVISDIKKHPNNVMNSTIKKKIIDEIYSFVPEVHIDRHPLPNLSWIRIQDYVSLVESINNIELDKAQCLVIYYTGHCEEGSQIILPDNNFISSRSLIEAISSKCNKNTEILTIFDCCNAGNISMPYVFNRNKFTANSAGELINANIIYLSSSNDNQPSRSSNDRSYFTKYLVAELERSTININLLIANIQSRIDDRYHMKGQNVSVYSSFIRPPSLFSWVLPSGVIIQMRGNMVEIRDGSLKLVFVER